MTRISRPDFIRDMVAAGLTTETAATAYESMAVTIAGALKEGNHILMPNVVKLEARFRKPRTCKSNLNGGGTIYYGERIAFLVRIPKHLRFR